MLPRRVSLVVALASAALAIAACGRAATSVEPAAAPWSPRPLTDVVFERTAARREHGERLANGLLQCVVCHSPRDWDAPGAPPLSGRAFAGAVWWDKPWLVAPNLTPDADTGIGRWTDDMVGRAIREGIGHDGRRLDPQMWSASFSGLVDEDLASVVVYLRSLRPIANPLPSTVVPAGRTETPEPPMLPDGPPDLSTLVARGRYLAGVGDCSGCHTSWYTPKNPGLYGGGNLIRRSNHQAYSSNITSDPSGISYYDAALFREVMRTGRLKGRTLSPVMPWVAFRHATDADLDAIFAYLTEHRPVRHVIDNVNTPTLCAICRGTHPLGEYNTPPDRPVVSYATSDVRDVAGTYRLYPSFMLNVELRGGRLFMSDEPGADACELKTGDRRRFRCDDGVDEIEFVRDATGRVTHLVANGVDPAPKVK